MRALNHSSAVLTVSPLISSSFRMTISSDFSVFGWTSGVISSDRFELSLTIDFRLSVELSKCISERNRQSYYENHHGKHWDRTQTLFLFNNRNIRRQVTFIVWMYHQIVIRIVIAVIVLVFVWSSAIMFCGRRFVVFLFIDQAIVVLCSRRCKSTLNDGDFVMNVTTFLCYGFCGQNRKMEIESWTRSDECYEHLLSKLERHSASFFSDFLSKTLGR